MGVYDFFYGFTIIFLVYNGLYFFLIWKCLWCLNTPGGPKSPKSPEISEISENLRKSPKISEISGNLRNLRKSPEISENLRIFPEIKLKLKSNQIKFSSNTTARPQPVHPSFHATFWKRSHRLHQEDDAPSCPWMPLYQGGYGSYLPRNFSWWGSDSAVGKTFSTSLPSWGAWEGLAWLQSRTGEPFWL